KLEWTLLSMSWHTTVVHFIETSTAWAVCIGLHLDLWGTARCLDHYKSPPAWLIPSGTRYLSPWWSTYLGDM
uniref:Uncharacterized protein n=1 Tax=Strix occidentalis caurina TaxID=311401 RepID=A0A8D0KX47_STROC